MLNFEDNELFVEAPVAYSVLDATGTQIAANRKFWQMFRCEPSTGLSVAQMTHGDFQDSTADYLEQLVKGQRSLVVVNKRYVRADGTEFWGRLTAQSVTTNDGEAVLVGVIEDIDEQYALEVRLREMATQQSEFVARVSHELRNPLHTIAGLAELLSSADIDQQAKRQASIVLREATALTSIVSDLLDIGKIDTGNLSLDESSFAVRSVIDRSVRSAHGLAAPKQLIVNASVDDAIPIYVAGDAGRLGQIIDNLCGNAIKFTSVGSITVSVRKGIDDRIVFRVADTGPGIPADRQADIFEPFQRLNASAPGAGLGLAISARLAQSMGGSLRLETSSHEGSTFVLELPLPASTAPVSRIVARAANDKSKTSRILVVEDNAETQMLASAQLNRLGYDHDVVGDGYQALEISERVRYGAILMDWHLPGIDGLETTRRMRQREEREGRSRTPIISVTARAMAADIEACRQAGADDFIAKPASLGRVGEVLERWAGDPELDRHPESGAVDTGVFSTLMDELGDVSLVLSIARTFLSELPRRVASITDSGESEAAELAAHTLKSTSAMLGAHGLRDISAAIEETARSGAVIQPEQQAELRVVAATTENAVLELIKRLEPAV